MTAFPSSIGPFKIHAEIGSGSSGKVFKAFDERLSRWVAIKLLYAYQDQDIGREARLLASLSHPNIVAVYDIIEDKEQQCTALVMEYLPGKTLRTMLTNVKICSVKSTLKHSIDIAKGLSAAHQAGIIHRDLKAENIFFDFQEHLKIGDFGIANHLGEKDANTMFGTLRALSPEQALGEPLTAKSDLFSLGVLMYQMISGHHPFDQNDGDEDMLKRLVNDDYLLLNCESEALKELIEGLLLKDPTKRFESSQYVVNTLQTILDEHIIQNGLSVLKQSNPILVRERLAQKNKDLLSLALAILAFAVVALVLFTLL